MSIKYYGSPLCVHETFELTSRLAIRVATSRGGGLDSLKASAPMHGSNTVEIILKASMISKRKALSSGCQRVTFPHLKFGFRIVAPPRFRFRFHD